MALTGGGANTDLCRHRPRCAHGEKEDWEPWTSVILRLWGVVPSVLRLWVGYRGSPHHTGVFFWSVIFGLESHTEGSGIRTLAPRYHRKSMLLLFTFHFLDVCRHLRTCCACTCKDYVCIHSQPKWPCHFGSSLILNWETREKPTHPRLSHGSGGSHDGTPWWHPWSIAGRDWQAECSTQDTPDGKGGAVHHSNPSGWR